MKHIIQKYAKVLLISGSALIFAGSAFAGKTHLTMGMVLEPPHLDPTAGAAAAIDEVVYANVFEGLTQDQPKRGGTTRAGGVVENFRRRTDLHI